MKHATKDSHAQENKTGETRNKRNQDKARKRVFTKRWDKETQCKRPSFEPKTGTTRRLKSKRIIKQKRIGQVHFTEAPNKNNSSYSYFDWSLLPVPIYPPLPSGNTVSYPSSKHSGRIAVVFGWLVLNVSRHQMTSQHCIDSSTLRSASLPRPLTHMMWPYPWPWRWRNIGNRSQMVQQIPCACSPHLDTNYSNLDYINSLD